MNNGTSSGNGQQAWWAVLGVGAALLMALKPWGALTPYQWKWVAGGLGVAVLWRVWGLLRSSSSSPGRILMWMLGLAMVGSVVVVGIPTHWLRVPAWSDVVGVVTPMVLGLAAVLALLVGLAGLNRQREMNGAPQRSYLPILLNLVILAAVWQVVRQPLWRESMKGMMALPQLGSQRRALEESLASSMEQIKTGKSSTPAGMAAGAGNPTTAALEPDRKSVFTTHPLGPLPAGLAGILADSAPANAEQWIQAAIHNPHDPQLELRASIALVAEGRDDLAIRRLDAARERGCQSPDLLRFYARLLLTKNRPAAAASVLEALVASPQGTDEDLHDTLKAWEQAGQAERAETLAERVLVKRPSRDLFRWLAARDAAQGRYERALVLLGQLSRRTPFDSADAFQLAEVALRAGRPELALDAVALLEQAGHRSPRTTRLAQQAKASAVADLTTPPRNPRNQGGG
jgi:tetratricopeptide (TPR) repeat protein